MRAKMQVGGGYARINTLNQDSRQGRYHPHRSVSKFTSRLTDVTEVKCLVCGAKWSHPRGDVQDTPPLCKRAATKDDEAAGLEVAGTLDEDGEVRWSAK